MGPGEPEASRGITLGNSLTTAWGFGSTPFYFRPTCDVMLKFYGTRVFTTERRAAIAEKTTMVVLPDSLPTLHAHAPRSHVAAPGGYLLAQEQPSDREAGQALVEFALCLPVLLLLVFGIFSFGIAFSNYILLENATNIGARQLAISRGNSTDPCSTISSTVAAAAPLLKSTSLNYTFLLNNVTYTGTSCSGATTSMVQGATAKLTVTYPCTLASFRWNYGACTLTAAVAELIQ